mgnify:CR=1 FL=1
MENVITFIISTIVQTIMVSYFVFSISKIFTNKKPLKKQIILAVLLFTLIGIGSQILKYHFKNYFTILNLPFTILILFIITHFILKVNKSRSFLVIISMLVLCAITELLAMSISRLIFQKSMEEIINDKISSSITLVIQCIMNLALTKIFVIVLNKKLLLVDSFKKITYKQAFLYIILLIIYVFPQMILMIINKYAYTNTFLIINTIQFILICIFLSIYIKKSLEHDKVQMDLYTSELHNKTLVGMVDGVRTLKHDYNNIIQALNGYITTKQYDKLAEHINGVLKECNIINNLSVIDPKIFNEPAVYGVVGAKYFLANKDNITFDFDIMTDISKIAFPMPDLSRILGILLDNALEATRKSNKPYIMLEMKFDKRKNSDIIRVVNTYNPNIKIDLNKIYEKGFSTKVVKSGIGLWEVKKLVGKNKNSQVYATIEKDKFVQNIIIEKTE